METYIVKLVPASPDEMFVAIMFIYGLCLNIFIVAAALSDEMLQSFSIDTEE